MKPTDGIPAAAKPAAKRRRGWIVRDFLSSLGRCPGQLATCLVLYPLLAAGITLWVRHLGVVFHLQMCRGDPYCWYTFLFLPALGIVPAALYLLMHLLKYDFTAPFLIHWSSKQDLFLRQAVKTVLLAVLVALYYSLCQWAVSWVAPVGMNWDQPGSIYVYQVGTLGAAVPQWRLMLVLFGSIFFSVLAMGLCYLALRWITGRDLTGVLFAIVIAAFEMVGTPLLYNFLFVGYAAWRPGIPAPERGFLVGLLWAAVAMLVGYLASGRKDFLGEQQQQK